MNKKQITIGSLLSTLALPAVAAELSLKVELAQITTGQYVRPYTAIWLEKSDGTFVKSLALWHEVKDKRGNPLTTDKYLKNLRSWWAKSGASADMKFDSISSATKPAGIHEVSFTENLPAGKYQLIVEVAREVKVPKTTPRTTKVDAIEASSPLTFELPSKQSSTVEIKGKTELGTVSLTVKP